MKLSRTEHFRSQQQTESGVLYIYADKKGVLLFCSEKKYKPSYILMKAFKSSEEKFSALWIPYENLNEEAVNSAHIADEISEFVSQIWNFYTQKQNEILEAIISQETAETVMGKARGLLREPFTVVDRNMQLLYHNPEVTERMTVKLGTGYETEIEEELLMAKEFHEVAKRDQPFYYYMKNLNEREYCINIVVDGYYYARLVTFVDEGEETLPSGAEQISEYLATVLVQMIRNGALLVNKNQNDQFHVLCQMILNEGDPDASEFQKAVSSYRWEPTDRYQVFCLEPYNASGWKTQIENTMPNMIRKLEQTYRQSAAVFSGEKILWVINWTQLSEDGKTDKNDQQLMILLRENVFRAGASSVFSDFSLLASAFQEASEVLALGTKKEPSYWYYRFDDYRMSYMLNVISSCGIDKKLLIHPAIPLLMEHDRKHESQLCETLKMLVVKQGNVSQAAEALYIHRTTLFRRLNQVKELTGLDLENTELMLELQLSYRLIEL